MNELTDLRQPFFCFKRALLKDELMDRADEHSALCRFGVKMHRLGCCRSERLLYQQINIGSYRLFRNAAMSR